MTISAARQAIPGDDGNIIRQGRPGGAGAYRLLCNIEKADT
jgi:hypothetical protein